MGATRGRGLVDRGRLVPDLADTLRALARPSAQAEGRLRTLTADPAVRGNAILLPEELLRNGLNAEGALSRLDAAGMRASESRQLVAFLGSRMLRQAKIGAAARDRAGRLLRSPTVLTVLDTEAGRAVLRPQRGGTLFIPADHERLRQQVDELIRVAVSATAGR